MRKSLLSSFWFVSLATTALAGCGASVDQPPLAESALECAEEPQLGPHVRIPAPEARVTPATLVATDEARPELGPRTDHLLLPRDLGFACAQSRECASGQCFDGVCCAVSCGGVCEACNLPGAVGFCIAHAAGTDPEVGCGAPGCYAGMREAFSCDGAGSCQVQIESCGNYACGETNCLDACRSDADCSERAYCAAGKCLPD